MTQNTVSRIVVPVTVGPEPPAPPSPTPIPFPVSSALSPTFVYMMFSALNPATNLVTAQAVVDYINQQYPHLNAQLADILPVFQALVNGDNIAAHTITVYTPLIGPGPQPVPPVVATPIVLANTTANTHSK